MNLIEYFIGCNNGRYAEGYLSWQHILFVTLFMLLASELAVLIGINNKFKDFNSRMKILKVSTIIIYTLIIFKSIVIIIRGNTLNDLYNIIPLFLGLIIIISISLASFSKGRIQEYMLDFCFIIGILIGILRTFFAYDLYSVYPVIHFDTLLNTIIYSIIIFISLYIGFCNLHSMNRRNFWTPYAIFGIYACFLIIGSMIEKSLIKKFLNYNNDNSSKLNYILYNKQLIYIIIVISSIILFISFFQTIYFIINKTRRIKNLE